MEYIVLSFCLGQKFEPIKNHWVNRVKSKCTGAQIHLVTDMPNNALIKEYAWWDSIRLSAILNHFSNTETPIVHIDMDIIIEKDLKPIVELPFDFIISSEIGGNKAFPPECSGKLGFGVCTGFYIVKKTSVPFLKTIFNDMKDKKYGSISDQVTIMNYIVSNKHTIKTESLILDGKTYTNKVIDIDGIKICVLDFDIVTRDPIINNGQFANHINIDNVGGTANFIKYFYQNLEELPLTCRCGKRHLGDNNICNHLELRRLKK